MSNAAIRVQLAWDHVQRTLRKSPSALREQAAPSSSSVT
jgi:hypothetical protein